MLLCYLQMIIDIPVASYIVLKCDIIKFSFFTFQYFHNHISGEHDEKPSHTNFDMILVHGGLRYGCRNT